MNANGKTRILIEALPYIKKYDNKIAVIKLGGNAMNEINNAAEDIAFLKRTGMKVVVVHGGGPEIDKELKKMSIIPKFINGLRYTDEKVMKAVKKVFHRISKRIIDGLKSKDVKAIGAISCINAKQSSKKLGLVGKITKVDKDKLLKYLGSGHVPVISPIGIGKEIGKEYREYNINADTAASRIAVALGAEKLTILTNVDGIMINGSLLPHIDFKAAKKEIKNGNINKGMIPKVEACIYAVRNKCPKAHLINGLVPHSLLIEIFTDKGIGTEIVYKNGNK